MSEIQQLLEQLEEHAQALWEATAGHDSATIEWTMHQQAVKQLCEQIAALEKRAGAADSVLRVLEFDGGEPCALSVCVVARDDEGRPVQWCARLNGKRAIGDRRSTALAALADNLEKSSP